VIVLNYPPERNAKHSLKSWLEKNVAEEVYPGIGKIIAEKDDKFMKEVGRIKALEGEDLLFVYPNNYDPTRSRTTNPKKLRITEKMGYGDSAGIVDFVRKSVN